MFSNQKFQQIISRSLLPLIAVGFWTTQTSKSYANPPTKVSAELVLSVDISGSINSTEYNLQMQGYADAFKDDDVIAAIESLPHGLAVNLQFWAAKPSSDIGWTVIKNQGQSIAFANQLKNLARPSSSSTSIWGGEVGYYTNVSGAITAAADLILNNNYDGDSLVIDISGDGRSNSYQYTGSLSSSNYSTCWSSTCQPVKDARDAAVSQGIVINGLPIDSSSSQYIVSQYNSHVIGGDNAFVQVSNGFSDFTTAATQKITTEISNAANAPHASNDNGEVYVNESITLDVINNDSDPNGQTLTITDVTTPSGGTATINNDNTITYTAPSTDGTYTFQYTVTDPDDYTATATVTVIVNPYAD